MDCRLESRLTITKRKEGIERNHYRVLLKSDTFMYGVSSSLGRGARDLRSGPGVFRNDIFFSK